MHKENAFVTLTYDDKHYKPSLDYTDLQLWLKRLRKKVGEARYFAVGEYGDKFGRPHWHVLLFGVDLKGTQWSSKYMQSQILKDTWTAGNALYGDVTPESAAYCTKYAMNRKTGAMADGHYWRIDLRNGMPVKVSPEMAHMSLKPGLGTEWFKKHWRDIYTKHDAVLHNKKMLTPPKAYDLMLEQEQPELWDDIATKRIVKALEFEGERTEKRLQQRELVALAMYQRNESL